MLKYPTAHQTTYNWKQSKSLKTFVKIIINEGIGNEVIQELQFMLTFVLNVQLKMNEFDWKGQMEYKQKTK